MTSAPFFDGTQPCTEIGTDVFFEQDLQRRAIEVCQGCVFVEPCERYATERPWLQGVWGATNHAQRKRAARHTRTVSPEWY